MHVRQMRTVLAIALAAGALVVLDSGRQVSAAPPPCIPFEGHCYAPCTDPSSLCPPNSSYAPEYTWQDGSTGGTFEEFTGGPGLPSDFASFTSSCPYDPTSSDAGDYQLCSVPSGNGPTNPPNSADAWFAGDSNHVAVAAGELHVTTSWTSSIQDCTDYWHYVVGDSVHGCWESGTVSQQDSVWSPPTGATEHFAFRAKWVQDSGTSIPDLDSTLQASSDFPPEIDVVESSEPSTSFTSFVHCLGESPGLQDQNATSLNLFAWHTYEFALTSTNLYVYVDGTQEWDLNKSSSNCATASGQSTSDWPPAGPNGDNYLRAFMEAVMGTNGSFPAENQQQEAAKQTILIDWIAEE